MSSCGPACARFKTKARLSQRRGQIGVWPEHAFRFPIDIIGIAGATLTTLCWLPQILKVIREKETRALSLPTTVAFTSGVALWLFYGLAIEDWALIGSNAATLALMLPILAMKLRHG